MAEFGLAVAVFQLLDHGIKLAHTAASAKDAPGDIQTLLQDLKYLKNVLSEIFCVGKKEPECLQGPINEFTKDLEVLTKSLDDLDLKKTKRVRWALGEEKRVKKATERMEAYKSLFSMAMVADERKLAEKAHETVLALRQEMGVFRVEEKAAGTVVLSEMRSEHKRQKHLEYLNEERKQEKLIGKSLEWICKAETKTNHDTARENCMVGSGEWFIKGVEFEAWIQGQKPYLWLNGIPGAGKSVLVSSVIERLREREVLLQNGDLVAYYYFTFNDFEKRKIVCMLENLVAQVALHGLQTHQRSVTDILVQLYQKYRNSLHRPSNSELSDALMDMVGVSEKGYVFIVVDALDECSDNNILLKVLRSIHAQQKTRLRVLVSSRPEAGILETLNSLKFFSVPLETSVVDADIERYVDMRLTRSSRWEFLGQDLKDSIRKKLVTGSKGMFRLVECQLDIIEKRGRSPAIIKEALAHLPAKLDSVYSRILQQIDKSDWQDVHRILTWLVASKIPLDADTLSFVPTIDPGEQSVDLNRRLLRPQHDILELCGSLVKTTAGKFGRQIIVLAHYSVAEYLTRLSFDDGTSLSCFAIRMQDADSHICAASIVLFQWLEAQGLESENKRSEARRSMKRILDYCLEHWWKHASSQVQIERMDLIRSLLRDRRGWCLHLDAKIHISLKMSPTGYYCQSSKHNFARARGIERHCGCPEIELYIATVLGLCEVVAASIADGAELSASVFIAAIKGQHRDVVELLLKNQIDPNFSVACRTPLTVAINATLTPTQTSKDIIELLLRYGANPNCPPSTNPLARQYGMWEEPLNFAGISRNTGVINLLLAYGAKIQSPTFRWGRGHGKFSDCCVAAGKWCGCDRPYFTSEWCGLGTTAYERPKCLRDTKQWRMSEC